MNPKSLIAFVALLAAIVLPITGVVAAQASRPNVIIVCVDDVGFSDVGFNGNPVIQSPNLDQMAKDGLNLTNFHTSTVCAPGRAAILTGRDHLRAGVWSTTMNYYRIRRDETCIAEPFEAAGYKTGMFGKWHNGDNYPYRPEDRGFQEVVRCGGGGVSQTPDYWGNDYFDDVYFHNGEPKQYSGYCTDVWFGETIRFIEESKNDPFFIYLAPNAAHWPAIAPKEYIDLYRDHPRLQGGRKSTPMDSWIFYAMITNIDDNMGRLDAKLRELGLFDNTIVLFTSDNGSRDAEAVKGFTPRFPGSKASARGDAGTRVPTLLRWPSGGLQAAGSTENTLLGAQDLVPTFMDICDLPNPKGTVFDGISILPVLQGASDWPERMLFEQQGSAIHPQTKGHKFCVRTQKWRLFQDALYDIENDNRQSKNVANEYPEVVQELTAAYEAWYDSLQPGFQNLTHIVVGNPAENPSVITCHDWSPEGEDLKRLLELERSGKGRAKHNVPWLQKSVAGGVPVNGYWHIDVEQAGTYQVELRRWPREADKPMNWGNEPTAGMNAVYEAARCAGETPLQRKTGKKLKIDAVRLKIGDTFDETREVQDRDHAVVFEVTLSQGKTTMQSWMINQDKPEENRGAYYVYMSRVE